MTRPALILCLACMAATIPPAPNRPVLPVQSPKGGEFARSLAKAPSKLRATIAPSLALVWTYTGDTNNPASNVVFVVSATANPGITLSNRPVLGEIGRAHV